MRSFVTLGALSLVGAAALFACGDDEGGPGTGGTGGAGGSAGSGGAGGSAGTAGAGGSAGSAGAGGSAGSAGSTGGPPPCTGCIEVEIPFTAADQEPLYQIVYPAPGRDFSEAVITWSIQVVTPNAALFIRPQVQNGAGLNYAGYYDAPEVPLAAATFPAGQWRNVALDLTGVPGVGGGADAGADGGDVDAGDGGAVPPANVFDKSIVEAIQLLIGANAAGTGTATVLIDSVTITGVPGTTGATFNAGLEGFVLNNYGGSPTPPGTPAPVSHPQ